MRSTGAGGPRVGWVSGQWPTAPPVRRRSRVGQRVVRAELSFGGRLERGAEVVLVSPSPTTPTPLYVLAEDAQLGLGQRFAQRSADVVDTVAVAARVHADGRASVNRRPEALLGFLNAGRMLNQFEFAEQRAREQGRDVDDVLRQSLGRFYTRRIAFEGAMGGGQRFYYAAMNIGGLGSPHYGPYCVVLRQGPSASQPHEPLWVREDSLKGPWWTTDDALDEPSLSQGVATPPQGHVLTALKLTDAGSPGPEPGWSERVCNHDEYVEALLTTAPVVGDTVAVRASASHVADLERRVLDALRGPTPLPEPDLLVYTQIRDKLDEHGIPFEEVTP